MPRPVPVGVVGVVFLLLACMKKVQCIQVLNLDSGGAH